MQSKIKIIPKLALTIEIDGKKVSGCFRIDSEWNGLLKLSCDAPMGHIIIRPIAGLVRSEQYVPKIFGGCLSNQLPPAIEAEVISHNLNL